ncbi:MAG: AMMECR1 domain-containing protein [Bacteroidales bacterium]
MFTPKTAYAKIAFETILFVVKTGDYRRMEESRISADLKLQTACFVTAENSQKDKMLKSGNIRPQTPSLYDEILLHAKELVPDDINEQGIEEDELTYMKVQVHVASSVEQVTDFSQIKPGKRGVWIEQEKAVEYMLPQETKKIKKGSDIVTRLMKRGTLDDAQPYKVYTFRVATYE